MIKTVMKCIKDNFFMRLIKSNTGVSSKNFFLVCVTLIGLALLGVLMAGFIVDMVYNHTITVSMSEAAGFIGAISALFATAGLTKVSSEWSENKYLYNTNNTQNNQSTGYAKTADKVCNDPNSQRCEGDEEDVPICNEDE